MYHAPLTNYHKRAICVMNKYAIPLKSTDRQEKCQ
jgi:hypothetical protein